MENLKDLKNIQLWLLLPMDKRMEIRREHTIKASGKTQVADNKLQLDGITAEDLSDFPKDVLLKALGVNTEKSVEEKINEKEEVGEEIKEDKEEVKEVEGESGSKLKKYFQ
ncbi:MAG: hypothetical protein ACTSQH_00410 [Candidatus Hodarchaeales archaeon]